MPSKPRDPMVRFSEKIHVLPNGCHLWKGSDNGNGYPQFFDGRAKVETMSDLVFRRMAERAPAAL